MKRKAIILGIKGTKLTSDEKRLLKNACPWGIILFSRNIDNLFQLKTLITSIKKIVNDKYYPILIDQEGGLVSRLNKIINLDLFSQRYFAKIYKNDKVFFLKLYKSYIDKICHILRNAGININTVPVLDVISKRTNKMIGSRCFSSDPQIVSKLGNYCIHFYNKNKIATVVKHIPGHGLSKTDSHFKLPIANVKKKKLLKNDFIPFKKCKSQFAMTAHIIYSVYDPIYAATHSKIIINEVIRKYIGFNGILISDDISMKALKYGLVHNAIKALKAGCNLVMHCNVNIKEMQKLIKIIPTVDKFTEKKTSQFTTFIG